MASSRVVSATSLSRWLIPALAALTIQCNKDGGLDLVPLIDLSTTGVTFDALQGGADPAAQTVSITNQGDGTLDGLAANVTYTDGQPTGWLSASLSGTAAPATLTLTATTGSLTAGTYTAEVAVSSDAADNSPAAASVTFTVAEPPAAAPLIALSSNDQNFSVLESGGNPAVQTVEVANGGEGILDGLAASVSYTTGQPAGWLSAALSVTTAPSTLTLGVTTGSLVAGTYTAIVAVSSAAASNSPQAVNVTFTVTPAGTGPTIALSSTSRSFSATQGGDNPAAQQVSVSNAGGETLDGLGASVSYTTGQPTGWLNASLDGTTAPSTLTLTATTGVLAAGTYTASVAVTSAVASNSPQIMSVTFTVRQSPSANPSIALSRMSLSFGAEEGGRQPDEVTVQVTNGGGGTLSVLAARASYTDGQATGWLDLALNSTTAPTDLTFLVVTEDLVAGAYMASVEVTSGVASNSPQAVSVSLTITPRATTPPAAPSGLGATAVSTDQIDLTWTDNASDEAGFRIERCTGDDCTDFAEITTVGANIVSYESTGLAPGTSYSYRVRAHNSAGDSEFSNTGFAVTPTDGGSPPAAPSDLSATAVSTTQVDLSWTDHALNEQGFRVHRCDDDECTGSGEVGVVGPNVTNFEDQQLEGGTSYSYRVLAYNGAGESEYSNTVDAVTPLAAPTDLTATAHPATGTQVDLAWTDASNNEDNFHIERCTGAECNDFAEIEAVEANVTIYHDTGLSGSTSYSYRVRASNSTGPSDPSNVATAVTSDQVPPAQPTNLTATAASTSQINLTWTDNADNEEDYRVERCTGATCTGADRVLIATLPANSTSYENTGLEASTTYRYVVAAFNAYGIAFGNSADATTRSAWTTKAPMPSPRGVPARGVVNGILYVVGGSFDGTNGLTIAEAYDPVTNSWATKTAMPTPRWGPAAAVVNGILYVFGGYHAAFGYHSKVEAYNPATDSWTTKAAMPTARYGAMAGVIDGIIYVAGGQRGGTVLSTVEAYNPAADSWTTSAPLPVVRRYGAAGVVNGIFYIAGGDGGGTIRATVEAYNPATDMWTTKAAMPTPRHVVAGDVVDGILYVAGGVGKTTVEAYDPVMNAWRTETSMLTPRWGAVAGVVNGVLYVAGGKHGNAVLGTLEAYQP